MVEFEYQPWRKIVVHEIIKYPLEYFILQSTMGIDKGEKGRPLLWSDGVLFTPFLMQTTPEIIKEQLEGVVHWASLNYCVMNEYKKELVSPQKILIPVIDVSNHQAFGSLGKWLNKKFEGK